MPNISKIQLPSGGVYDIVDAQAREMLSAGVSFIVAWDGTSSPVAADIPSGVKVTYNNTETTGSLSAASSVAGAFYLVKSKTLPTDDTLDNYDEYVVIKPDTEDDTTWYWEKIGDTRLNLSNVVTDVTFTKNTDTVIGTDATFTITQPTVALDSSVSSGTGKVSVISSVSANNTNVAATASGANTAWNTKDTVTAVTGYSNPSTDTFIKTVSATSKKLATTSVTGVSGSTTASKATATTNLTSATGSGTATTDNADWLKGISVSNGVLTFGAASLNTQSTAQYTFSDVTVPTAASSATTVATGAVADSDTNGATVITAASAGSSASAITALGTPSTKSAIGADSTFTVTQPTVALATGATAGTGVISLTNSVTPTSAYIGATASGANTAWNNKDSVTVLTNATTVTATKGE